MFFYCTGRPFTRLKPSDPDNNLKKSCLNFIILSKPLAKYVDSIKIDKERTMTPCHAMNKNKLVYPDHLSILTTFKNIPKKKEQIKSTPKIKLWNLNREGGWDVYKSLTENNKALKKVASMENKDPEIVMNKIEREMKKLNVKALVK